MRTKRKQNKLITKINPQLDLHGIKHSEVKHKLEDFINTNYDFFTKEPELTIITGNSNQMKKIVKEILEEYKFEIVEIGPKIFIS